MNRQRLAVMQRRSELLAKISSQREQLSGIGMRWEKPLALADRGLAVGRFLRARPALTAGIVALLVIRRRGVMGLARSGLLIWKGYRYFATFSEKLPRN